MTTQCRSPELLLLKIIATGAALPPNRVASSTLDARTGKPAGYVEKRSGIVYRYHAADDASGPSSPPPRCKTRWPAAPFRQPPLTF